MQLKKRALLIAITCAVSTMVEAQVLSCANGRVGLPCSEVAIQYDEAGNITKIGSDNYRYDTLNRLKFADLHNGIALSENFTYDAFGNLTKVTYAGRPERTLATDELTNHLSTATYDDAGRALNDGLTTYAYDAGGMVTEASTSGGGRMLDVYGPGGERIGTMTAGSGSGSLNQYVAKWTVRGGGAKVAREFREDASAGTPSISWTRDYIFRDGVLLGELLPNTAQDERINHYHVDHLGTPRLITDEAGIEVSEHQYEPFGEELTPIAGQMESLKFTGHERDFLGGTNSENKQYVDYMHARYYGSVLGRFLSVDPSLDLKKTIPNAQMWNRYAYVLNNPIRHTDPDGREHVGEPGFTKPLSEAGDWSEMPAVSWAFYSEGALLSLAAGGPVVNAVRSGWQMLVGFVLCNPTGARQLLDAALSPPGSSTLPTSISGEVLREFNTSKGAVGILANASSKGTVLTLKDAAVYPMKSGALTNQIGNRQMLEALKQLGAEAKAAGYTKLIIEGKRATGANPGKIAQVVLDLTKL